MPRGRATSTATLRRRNPTAKKQTRFSTPTKKFFKQLKDTARQRLGDWIEHITFYKDDRAGRITYAIGDALKDIMDEVRAELDNAINHVIRSFKGTKYHPDQALIQLA